MRPFAGSSWYPLARVVRAFRSAALLLLTGDSNIGSTLTFLQERSVAMPDGCAIDQPETGRGCGLQFRIECGRLDVPAWFGEENRGAGFGSRGDLGEKAASSWEFMDHSKCEGEVRRALQVCNAHRLSRCDAGIHSVKKAGLGGAAFQALDHLGLNVHRNHPPGRPHKTRESEREEAHARTRFQHRYPFADIGLENFVRVLPIPSQRAGQPIAQPPGTDAMGHFSLKAIEQQIPR